MDLHTRVSLLPEKVARADRDHAHDVPCVITLPILSGDLSYPSWIYDETRTPKTAEA